MTPANLETARDTCKKIAANISKVMRGQAEATRNLVAVMAAGGHVLLEDFPGTGKTTLAKALARSIDARLQFKRLQFTPDLLPSDILGVSNVFQPAVDQEFHFHEGPVFTNISAWPTKSTAPQPQHPVRPAGGDGRKRR